MLLGERGSYLPHGRIWVREIRRLLEKSGHQTPIVCTDRQSDAGEIAAKMFSRWSQENFFKYMMQHYGIDRLADYKLEEMDETVRVVNPCHRELDSRVRSLNAQLARRHRRYAQIELKGSLAGKRFKKQLQEKAALPEEIQDLQKEIDELKAQRKQTPRHISFKELPPEQQFKKLKAGPKQLIDTIKMIAYRAETAMANLVQENLGKKKDEARSIVRQIFQTDADLEPDEEKGILKVRLHNLTNPRNNRQAEPSGKEGGPNPHAKCGRSISITPVRANQRRERNGASKETGYRLARISPGAVGLCEAGQSGSCRGENIGSVEPQRARHARLPFCSKRL